VYRKVAFRMDFCLPHCNNHTPVILISDNFRSEKIDCACQVVEIDLLGSTLDKIVWELIKRSWCYRDWTECNSNWFGR